MKKEAVAQQDADGHKSGETQKNAVMGRGGEIIQAMHDAMKTTQGHGLLHTRRPIIAAHKDHGNEVCIGGIRAARAGGHEASHGGGA